MQYELNFQKNLGDGVYGNNFLTMVVIDLVPSVGDIVTVESPLPNGTMTFKVLSRHFHYYQTEAPSTGFVTKVFLDVSVQ